VPPFISANTIIEENMQINENEIVIRIVK